MKRFQCRVEYLANSVEILASLSKGEPIKEIYNTLLKSEKISMSYRSFYNYCTGKIKAIHNVPIVLPVEKDKPKKTLLVKPLPATETVKFMEDKQAYF